MRVAFVLAEPCAVDCSLPLPAVASLAPQLLGARRSRTSNTPQALHIYLSTYSPPLPPGHPGLFMVVDEGGVFKDDNFQAVSDRGELEMSLPQGVGSRMCLMQEGGCIVRPALACSRPTTRRR